MNNLLHNKLRLDLQSEHIIESMDIMSENEETQRYGCDCSIHYNEILNDICTQTTNFYVHLSKQSIDELKKVFEANGLTDEYSFQSARMSYTHTANMPESQLLFDFRLIEPDSSKFEIYNKTKDCYESFPLSQGLDNKIVYDLDTILDPNNMMINSLMSQLRSYTYTQPQATKQYMVSRLQQEVNDVHRQFSSELDKIENEKKLSNYNSEKGYDPAEQEKCNAAADRVLQETANIYSGHLELLGDIAVAAESSFKRITPDEKEIPQNFIDQADKRKKEQLDKDIENTVKDIGDKSIELMDKAKNYKSSEKTENALKRLGLKLKSAFCYLVRDKIETRKNNNEIMLMVNLIHTTQDNFDVIKKCAKHLQNDINTAVQGKNLEKSLDNYDKIIKSNNFTDKDINKCFNEIKKSFDTVKAIAKPPIIRSMEGVLKRQDQVKKDTEHKLRKVTIEQLITNNPSYKEVITTLQEANKEIKEREYAFDDRYINNENKDIEPEKDEEVGRD